MEQVTVPELKFCDFCAERGDETIAQYDFKTRQGPWANGCRAHYERYRKYTALGLGMGQELIYPLEVVKAHQTKMKEDHEAGVNSFAAHCEGYN